MSRGPEIQINPDIFLPQLYEAALLQLRADPIALISWSPAVIEDWRSSQSPISAEKSHLPIVLHQASTFVYSRYYFTIVLGYGRLEPRDNYFSTILGYGGDTGKGSELVVNWNHLLRAASPELLDRKNFRGEFCHFPGIGEWTITTPTSSLTREDNKQLQRLRKGDITTRALQTCVGIMKWSAQQVQEYASSISFK